MILRWQTFKEYIYTHEQQVSLGALALGFVWDSLTLGRPDQLFNNVVFVTYLIISGASIFLIALYERRNVVAPALLLPAMQFSFGNLGGGLFIVYGQSGSLEGSALFFILLFAFIFGNEFLRSYYARISFHIAAWYFLLFAYLTIIIPILLGKLGGLIFMVSGIFSLVIITLFLFLLKTVSPERVVLARKMNIALVSSVFLILNVLYFYNIIPPVPLSITEIGIYHSLTKLPNGNYGVAYEKPLWWQWKRSTSSIFNRTVGDSAYCFSSVFAPIRLSSGVYHRWEYYVSNKEEWETATLVPFSISGGREGGYRGYSIKTDLALGKWRCSVETSYGALIGRTTFTVVNADVSLALFEKEL
ncbi:MAG: hypothetical protein A2648_02760 [Candidatus Lloydbacteria bacterium RIFCSPHIGHO2_01_FULL_41_20]|uniref:DUF2914 domain-containing protein n=1 Tax=Candidatus Lloydbacteria bacterium RIFCSPHIGHO2_01_FULL_41_20 TaxID=1798657 RepID=A0A1G2CU09_9BACT|nr:MAG: hypothetical protein A2648_02760 [Candidatus Lloydbacteria bacterium RIFCSPHIGHO2_01_FULL_41_20]